MPPRDDLSEFERLRSLQPSQTQIMDFRVVAIPSYHLHLQIVGVPTHVSTLYEDVDGVTSNVGGGRTDYVSWTPTSRNNLRFLADQNPYVSVARV